MLQSEGGWTLNLRLASSVGRGLNTKSGTLTLQNVRLPCDKRMAYAAVRGRIGAEPAIRLSDRNDSIQKTSTPTLQDAQLSCDKRMAYAAV